MCLSPIRLLFKEVIDIFRINSQSFFDAVKEIVSISSKQIKIKIVCEPLKGIRELNAKCNLQSNTLEINECLLCATWAASYFVANAYVALSEYLNGTNKELVIELDALELIQYAKSLIPSFEEWHDNLPIPQDYETNPYVKLANMIMPIATDVILCHEIAHINLNHQKNGGIQQEIDADNLAVSWILDSEREEYPVKELAVMTAFVAMILIDATAHEESKRHPSSFERIENYLEKLHIDENDILWTLSILIYRAWERNFNKMEDFIQNNDNLSYKEEFMSYLASHNM